MGCTTSSPSAEVTGEGGGQKVNGAKHASTVGGGSRERREANGGGKGNGESRRNSRIKGE